MCDNVIMRNVTKNPEFLDRQLVLPLYCEVVFCQTKSDVKQAGNGKLIFGLGVLARGFGNLMNGCMMKIGMIWLSLQKVCGFVGGR